MSSLADPFSYADLPNDVGRLIFECLAEMDMPSCALVSRRVQSWYVHTSLEQSRSNGMLVGSSGLYTARLR